MLNIVIFGPPGAGKGTQSEKIIIRYKLIHLSTGDLLREEIKNETRLGLEAKSLMDNGKLVPDEVVVGMISNKLKSNPDAPGFLFDGFPRTIEQATALDRLLAEHETKILVTLSLEVAENELIKRLLHRGQTSDRADDQDTEKIKTRLHEYESKTLPVAKHYGDQKKLIRLPGLGSIEKIFSGIIEAIEYSITNN